LAIPEAWKDPTLWPMGAASALMTVGIAGDNKFPGNIENFIRRKAHEAAYIPTAVTTLSYQLASIDLDEWLKTTDRQTIETIQAQSGGDAVGPIQQIAALAEGKLVSWIRGNILIHCLRKLSEEQYDAIKAQDANRDATRFLEALHDSIKSRLATATPGYTVDAPLAKNMDDFVDGASVLLASTLLQATPDARELSATITSLGFKEIDSSSPQTWTQFAILSTAFLCAAAFFTWLIAYLLPDLVFGIASKLIPTLKGLNSYQIHDYFTRITLTAVNTALLYSVIFVVLMYVRERRLNKRKWEEKLGSHIDLII
jgi:hypothetical protein